MNNLPFGNLQPETEPHERTQRSGKWTHKCDGCGEMFWSDEAANLHYIGDALIRLSNTFAQVMEEKK